MTPEIRSALDSPLPVSGLAMKAFAAPFKGTAPNASVLLGVEMRGRDLRLDASDKVAVTFIAVDAQGKVRGNSTNAVSMNLQPETKARVAATGLRLLNRVELPPGRYQIRFAAHDSGGGSVGTVTYDLDVPDFAKLPFSMSGLVLTSAAALVQPTVRPDEPLRQVLPGPPVAARSFPQNDEIALFAEVYDNQASKPHKVDITTTVTSDAGGVVVKTDEVRDSSELQGPPRRVRFRNADPAERAGARILRADRRGQISPWRHASGRAAGYVHGDRAARGALAMRPFMLVLVLAVLLPTLPLSPMSQAQTPPPAVRTVVKGQMSETDAPRQATVRSAAEWSALWKTHDPSGQLPAVDFSREMVVAVFLGSRPTAGYGGGDCEGGGEQRDAGGGVCRNGAVTRRDHGADTDRAVSPRRHPEARRRGAVSKGREVASIFLPRPSCRRRLSRKPPSPRRPSPQPPDPRSCPLSSA